VEYYCNSYPPHYKTAFAFSILPCPQPHQLVLRLAFPPSHLRGRTMGLPRSASEPLNGLGSACSPVAFHLRQGKGESLHLATCLLAQACGPLAAALQHLWLAGSHDVYQRFTYVSHTIHPSPQPRWCSQSPSHLTVWWPPSQMRVHCPKSFAPPDCSGRTSW
jgi:hypothetical protein